MDAAESRTGGAAPTSQELEALFEELENLSDSGPELEMDKVSIVSNPRPGLRPYFNSAASSKEVLPGMDEDVGLFLQYFSRFNYDWRAGSATFFFDDDSVRDEWVSVAMYSNNIPRRILELGAYFFYPVGQSYEVYGL